MIKITALPETASKCVILSPVDFVQMLTARHVSVLWSHLQSLSARMCDPTLSLARVQMHFLMKDCS